MSMRTLLRNRIQTVLCACAALGFAWPAALAGETAGAPATPRFTPDGFAVPQPGYAFAFPRDHGSHPEFKIEWWYLTGHLYTPEQRRFGYQATFFRNAAPGGQVQLHLAHMALVDVATGRFYHQERLNREGWDAGAATGTLAVHNGPWTLDLVDAATETLRLRGGVHGDVRFELTLRPTKPRVLFGENGLSRKGADPTAASYYITFTRLAAEGELQVEGQRFAVAGESWMDHEISSSQLSGGQVGWDWVSAQLADGREVMFYQLRRADGTADPASTLTWIGRDGTLTRRPFEWRVRGTWRSESTGAVYPVDATLVTTDPETGRTVELQLEPLVRAQELDGAVAGIAYWEGACRVRDGDGKEIGSAYMELTGYAKALEIR
jgi:predicted secreted hydrolase